MPLKHDHLPSRGKTNDGRRSWESNHETVFYDTCFSWVEYFPTEGKTSPFSYGGPGLAQSTPPSRAVAACYWLRRALHRAKGRMRHRWYFATWESRLMQTVITWFDLAVFTPPLQLATSVRKKVSRFVWTNIKPWFQTFSEWYMSSHCVLPVAQRAIKVWTCLRISVSLSSGSGSLLIMCSMKSFGVTAAKFHFNFPNTTSSHSWREIDKEPWQRESKNWEWQRTRKIKWHKARPHIFILCHTVNCT